MEKNCVSLDDRMPLLEVVADGIVSKMGDVTIALCVDQPEIFTLGAKDYERLHEAWVKAIRLLPPGTVVHMQETYRKAGWKADGGPGKPTGWLTAASNRFFEGRPMLRHECRLYLTRRPAGRSAVNSSTSGLLRGRLVPAGTFDAREQREFEDIVQQMSRVLTDSGLLKMTRIGAEDLASGSAGAGIIERYCWLSEPDGPVIRDIRFDDGLKVGNRNGVLYSLADADELPDRCSPAVEYGPYSGENARLYVGFTAGLGLLLPFDHIVSRYIVVEDPVRALARIEKRRLRLHSLARYSRSNAVAAEALNAWLGEASSGQLTPCRMHLNILAWVEDPSELRALRSAVVAAIAAMGAAPHEETVGLPQLWWAGIPGNAAELPENECFDTCLEQACCFLGMETNYRSLGSSFGIRLGDRLTGRPVSVDIDVEPRRLGWTGNNNLFVLSGSGGGKSFFMAHLCRIYHEWGMHTVVVDVGRSYETLCRLLDGAYITYEEEAPIAFNPFFIGEGRLPDVEKKESIKSLLLGLWKRSDEDHFRSEYITISNAVAAYYRMLAQRPEVFPCFDSFYEYMRDVFLPDLRGEGVGPKVFDSGNFLYVLRPYYRGGEFDFLLNAREDPDLSSRPFIVFELRNIVGHPILFLVVTMVIVEVFMAKVRTLRGTRKMIVIEEAWKAIASAGMAGEIRGWVKTLRKHMGKLALVSQELEDIIDSPIIKQAVINSSDTKILLDQSKFAGRFGEIQAMLGLSDQQKAEVLSINKGHDVGRPYKDVWIGLGPVWSRVYRLEVSEEEYLAYTSEEADKVKIGEWAMRCGGLRKGIEGMAGQMRKSNA